MSRDFRRERFGGIHCGLKRIIYALWKADFAGNQAVAISLFGCAGGWIA
jgi:hypothetical protein